MMVPVFIIASRKDIGALIFGWGSIFISLLACDAIVFCRPDKNEEFKSEIGDV